MCWTELPIYLTAEPSTKRSQSSESVRSMQNHRLGGSQVSVVVSQGYRQEYDLSDG